MMLRVYYDEIGGELYPLRVLIEPNINFGASRHDLNAPFERFYDEDFHDELKILNISQVALTRDPFEEKVFHINESQVKSELHASGLDPVHITDADYFLLLMSDLEEIMQLELKKLFL